MPEWIRLPSLPPFTWFDYVFRTIRNNLGHYLEVDMTFVHNREKGLARSLVILNPKEGLTEEINLKYKDLSYTQMINYKQLPF